MEQEMSDVRWVSDVRGVGRPKSTIRPRHLQTLYHGDFGRPLSVGRPTLRTSEVGRTSDVRCRASVLGCLLRALRCRTSELGRTSDVWSRAFPLLDCLFPGSLSLDLGVSLGVSCVPDDAKDRSVREHP